MIKEIKSDLQRLGDVSVKNFFLQYFFPRGNTFRYMVWLRICKQLYKNRVIKYTIGILPYIIFRHYEYKYGIHINLNMKIGNGLRIVHGECVHLNCQSIGSNVTIYQNVTCGANKNSDDIPKIKDNVTIYTGAVVVGKITLNEGCIIGANSYVGHDVEAGAVMVGLPAKKIR